MNYNLITGNDSRKMTETELDFIARGLSHALMGGSYPALMWLPSSRTLPWSIALRLSDRVAQAHQRTVAPSQWICDTDFIDARDVAQMRDLLDNASPLALRGALIAFSSCDVILSHNAEPRSQIVHMLFDRYGNDWLGTMIQAHQGYGGVSDQRIGPILGCIARDAPERFTDWMLQYGEEIIRRHGIDPLVDVLTEILKRSPLMCAGIDRLEQDAPPLTRIALRIAKAVVNKLPSEIAFALIHEPALLNTLPLEERLVVKIEGLEYYQMLMYRNYEVNERSLRAAINDIIARGESVGLRLARACTALPWAAVRLLQLALMQSATSIPYHSFLLEMFVNDPGIVFTALIKHQFVERFNNLLQEHPNRVLVDRAHYCMTQWCDAHALFMHTYERVLSYVHSALCRQQDRLATNYEKACLVLELTHSDSFMQGLEHIVSDAVGARSVDAPFCVHL